MPLSKERNAARMRAYRAEKRVGGTVLLSKAEVRHLHRLGVSPTRYLRAFPVSLDDYRDLQRQLEAKAAHVEWQKGGIRMLQDENATLKARIDIFLATDGVTELLQRMVQLEATKALEEVQRALE